MGDTINGRLQKAFGAHVRSEAPLADSGAGIRISGVDLCKPLKPEQVNVLFDALGRYRILTLAGQDLDSFSPPISSVSPITGARRCRTRAISSASAEPDTTNPNFCRSRSAPPPG